MSLFQLCQKVSDLPFSRRRVMIRRLMKMAVNNDVMIPSAKVTPKLLMGPVPKMIQDDGGHEVRDVGVDDGAHGVLVAQVDRASSGPCHGAVPRGYAR